MAEGLSPGLILIAWGLAGFFLLHVVLVLLSGPTKQLRDMITGGRWPEQEARQ